MLQDYKNYVYNEAFTEEHEELNVKNTTYLESVNESREELFAHVTDRRVKALPAAIETFNKIQGKKLP